MDDLVDKFAKFLGIGNAAAQEAAVTPPPVDSPVPAAPPPAPVAAGAKPTPPAGLDQMSHMDLLAYRNKLAANDPMQKVVAPIEHQAFAREFVQQSPVLGTISLGVSTPAYAIAKAAGLVKGRSGSDNPMGQIAAGYKGIWQGLTGTGPAEPK